MTKVIQYYNLGTKMEVYYLKYTDYHYNWAENSIPYFGT